MSTFDEQKARGLADKIVEAEAALSRYLGECFPAGARCGVMLMHGQINATPATICSVSPNRYGGEVCIQIDTAKQQSRQRYRRVNAKQVMDVVTTQQGSGTE